MRLIDILKKVLSVNECEQQGVVDTYNETSMTKWVLYMFDGDVTKGDVFYNTEYFYTYGEPIAPNADAEITTTDGDIVRLYKIEKEILNIYK